VENIEEEIKTLLDNYDHKLKEEKEKAKKMEEKEDRFLKEFSILCSEVIKPVMEQIGSQLKERGNDYSIEEEKERKDPQGRTLDAIIIMNIFPSEVKRHEYDATSTPHIAFRATRYEKKVVILGSNIMPNRGSSSSGPRGEFEIDRIDKDLVANEILKMLKEILIR